MDTQDRCDDAMLIRQLFTPAGEYTPLDAQRTVEEIRTSLLDPTIRRNVAWYSLPNALVAGFNERVIQTLVSQVFPQTETILWNGALYDTAIRQGRDAFTGVVAKASDFPATPQMWVFDRDIIPVPGQRHGVLPDRFVISAFWLIPVALFIRALRQSDSTGIFAEGFMHRLGLTGLEETGVVHMAWCVRGLEGETSLAEMTPAEWCPRLLISCSLVEGERAQEATADYLAAYAFMHLDIVEEAVHQAPRHERRRAEREGRRVPAPVKVVRLRKLHSAEQEASSHSAHGGYSCHFLVNSHWRKPHERMKEPRPVFVRGYVKGDTSKPFHAKSPTVHHVAR